MYTIWLTIHYHYVAIFIEKKKIYRRKKLGREKIWLSLISRLGVSMLLFMMIPIVSPLNSSIINVILCFTGGVLFRIGLGSISKLILTKSKLV